MSNHVLITGGSGTLGRALTIKLLKRPDVDKVVVFSRDEAAQAQMQSDTEFRSRKLHYHIGDITNRDAIARALIAHRITHVAHTAALKHVPVAEAHPSECVDVNVIGSRNVLLEARAAKVSRVVLVSTDKAAQPSNTYGLSKALMERLMPEYNGLGGMSVNVARFGNLVGSRGSVLGLFLKQIFDSGSVTVTDPEMTRFFIKITQAADTVMFGLFCPDSGLILVPNMKAATLDNFVGAVFEYAHAPRNMKIVGPRAGEKRHELVISQDESLRTRLVSEFHGYAITAKAVDDKHRVLKGELHSENSIKMDDQELLSMIQELGPAKTAV